MSNEAMNFFQFFFASNVKYNDKMGIFSFEWIHTKPPGLHLKKGGIKCGFLFIEFLLVFKVC